MDISAVTVEVQKLTMKPGDILVLRVDRILTNEQIDSMREGLEQIRPDGVKIAILDATCQLQIVEPPNGPHEGPGGFSPGPLDAVVGPQSDTEKETT